MRVCKGFFPKDFSVGINQRDKSVRFLCRRIRKILSKRDRFAVRINAFSIHIKSKLSFPYFTSVDIFGQYCFIEYIKSENGIKFIDLLAFIFYSFPGLRGDDIIAVVFIIPKILQILWRGIFSEYFMSADVFFNYFRGFAVNEFSGGNIAVYILDIASRKPVRVQIVFIEKRDSRIIFPFLRRRCQYGNTSDNKRQNKSCQYRGAEPEFSFYGRRILHLGCFQCFRAK
ncbi:hypothetical protein SDC9_88839 [bioreactor metagenome]|uniref:Uncharacterized protein n=1 Tax=bioreactor metagenome TaxID=1076179 RepID=A0A644ZN42_9ZZZZ